MLNEQLEKIDEATYVLHEKVGKIIDIVDEHEEKADEDLEIVD